MDRTLARGIVAAWSLALAIAANAQPAPLSAASVTGRLNERVLALEFAEAMTTLPDTIAPGTISIDGFRPLDCSWSDDDSIYCALDLEDKPAGATSFTAHIGAGLSTQAGEAFAPVSITVETARPKLGLSVQSWHQGLPTLWVAANQPATMAEVATVLRVQRDGVPVPYRLEPVKVERWRGVAGWRVLPEGGLEAGGRFELVELPGLRSGTAPLAGLGGEPLKVHIDRVPQLRGLACTGPRGQVTAQAVDGVVAAACVPNEPVTLRFSQAPDRASLERWTATWPATASFDAKSTVIPRQVSDDDGIEQSPDAYVSLKLGQPLVKIELAVPPTLASERGQGFAPARIQLAATHVRPAVRVPQGRPVIATGADDVPLAEAVATGALDVAITGIGAGSDATTLRIEGGRERDTAEPVLSKRTQRWLREGGWVRWKLDEKVATGHTEMQLAAPQLDLWTTWAPREVLVWANAWDGSGPVGGAAVELLRLAPGAERATVVAAGRTRADGTAVLVLPDDIVEPRREYNSRNQEAPLWLVRVAEGARGDAVRAVLPLAEAGWARFGEARPRWAWGVSDSPLHRAGDTVKFRLWLREEGDGRLRRPQAARDVTLRLVQLHQDDKPLREWQAHADASGAIAGEVQVPVHAPDGPYCVQVADIDKGACFYVGTFRPQDLWVQLALDKPFVRGGDRVALAAKAGYYSGGAAAGVPVRFETVLEPLQVDEAYPRFARYEFTDVDPEGIDSPAWRGIEQASVALDATGRAARSASLAFFDPDDEDAAVELPLLGRLRVTADARASDREGTHSDAATAVFARARRFVGLRVEDLYEPAGPARFDAIVVTAEGSAVEGVNIDVDVYRPDEGDDDDATGDGDGKVPGTLVGHCRVPSGHAAACDFQRDRSGEYVFRASSPDAEAVELRRYVRASDRTVEASKKEQAPTVSLLAAPAAPGAPARLLLRQSHARAQVLLVARQSSVLLRRVQDVDAGSTVLELPTDAGWVGKMEVTVIVRAAVPAQVEGPYRTPPEIDEASVEVELPLAPVASPPVSIAFAADAPRPGARARVVVRNDSKRERSIAVVVMDDAIRALAGDWAGFTDPDKVHALGRTVYYANWHANSFAAWRDPAKRAAALPWPDDELAGTQAGRESRRSRAQSQTVTESSPVATAVAAPAAILPEEFQYSGLDTITVTGTRIQQAVEAGRAPPGIVLAHDAALAALALAHVRSDFRDTALWIPDLRLAPGESRTLEFELPDNLTRWRALAWSSDADEDFALAEALQAAGLPIEARLQAPVRIYPGDTAVVAANVRRAEASDRPIAASLGADGAGVHASEDRAVVIDGAGQASLTLAIAPVQPGQVALIASAETAVEGERDAVATAVEVASPRIPARLVQAGWIGDAGVELPMPTLPDGASDAGLRVRLVRGGAGLVDSWTRDLHDYPHRCWEQILSRAVAAALALERRDPAWPDAADVVREALDNAAVFQDEAGDFRYFVPTLAADWHYLSYDKREYALTAYSVHALELLRALGHGVDPAVIERARGFLELRVHGVQLEKEIAEASGSEAARRLHAGQVADTLALALDGLDSADQEPGRSDAPPPIEQAWSAWEHMSLPARIATTRTLLRARHPAASTAVGRLLAQAPRQGESRHFTEGDDARSLRWMGSRLQEQCAVIGLLGEFPAVDPEGTARRQLLAGLSDLYAGGVESIDTHAGATCLVALRSVGSDALPVHAKLAYAGVEHALALEPGGDRTEWTATGAPQGTLRLERTAGSGSASYLAEIDYVEDARKARASAVGLRLERRYEVHRGGGWHPLMEGTLREGDWLRITLAVETAKPRHFVAVTDALPGGLQPADPQLRGVFGVALDALTDPGSALFATRRLDPRTPRFYAQWLPAGRHEIHYFARVGNRGDYLAAPAVAELMYGEASRARTAAQRLRIERDDVP